MVSEKTDLPTSADLAPSGQQVEASFVPRLIMLRGPEVGRQFLLRPGLTSVGRAGSNDVVIDRDEVSRHHCVILTPQPDALSGGVTVRDLGSTNGTVVADQPVGRDGVRVPDGGLIAADAVLCATGRAPHTQGLGLAEAGVSLDAQGAIEVDDNYRSSVPSIYAVGDVIAKVQLTPVALGEAMVVVDQLFGPVAGQAPRQMSYDFIPTAVFTHPSIGTVGWSEAQARERFGAIRVYCSEFKALKHTLSGSSERTLMKLIVDDASDRVVGLHMVGAEAGEIVQGFAVAMKAGATKAVFDATVGIHPTAAEEFVTLRDVTRR